MPGDRVAWHNHAVQLRKAGRFPEALSAIERAMALGLRAPETQMMHAHLLGDHGRFDEAVSAYRRALDLRPDLTDAHETLARLLPQLGRGGEALDAYRAALARAPDRGMLWVSAMATARALGDDAQLLAWARAAEARFGSDTMIAVFAAWALSRQGDDAAARDMLTRAVVAEPDYAPAQATLAHVLTRLGDARGAEAAALAATRLAPLDQSGWALLTVIWRLLDDPREVWLADYERLVMPIHLDIDAPRLAACLEALHNTLAPPGDQSLRGGTQTRGNLFDRREPEIVRLSAAIRSEVEVRLATLPADPAHPFLSRNTTRIAFQGSWSVRLRGEGFHISHIHPQGWMSSAFYAALPSEMNGGGDAGALAFGAPDAALGLDLPPRRIVRPAVGRLVIFPSYFWHGTLPFESASPRLTAAFDALPA